MFRDRIQAGQLLSKKLIAYKNSSDAVVVAIPHGGVPVAYQIATELNLPLMVDPCKKIRHPANKRRSIGSVGLGETIVRQEEHDIPQDYIAHQIQTLQQDLKRQRKVFSKSLPADLHGKTVILVDDRLKTGDTLLGGLRYIQNKNPAHIIVAVPVATPAGAQVIENEVDDFVCLEMPADVSVVKNYFNDLPVVEEEVIALLEKSSSESS